MFVGYKGIGYIVTLSDRTRTLPHEILRIMFDYDFEQTRGAELKMVRRHSLQHHELSNHPHQPLFLTESSARLSWSDSEFSLRFSGWSRFSLARFLSDRDIKDLPGRTGKILPSLMHLILLPGYD